MTISRSSKYRPRLSPFARWLAFLAAVAITVVFGIALWLVPDPRGFGTHQQLGMPECFFRRVTGLSCPHCGLTTSFCWFVRGNPVQACRVSIAGCVLAFASVLLVPWLILMSIKGVGIGVAEPGKAVLTGFGIWLLASIALWLIRMA